MRKKYPPKDDTPEGGWMGPPRTHWSERDSLPPLAIAVGSDRKGNWIWKKIKQTPKMRKKRQIWEKAQAKAEAKGNWSCRKNPWEQYRKKKAKEKE